MPSTNIYFRFAPLVVVLALFADVAMSLNCSALTETFQPCGCETQSGAPDKLIVNCRHAKLKTVPKFGPAASTVFIDELTMTDNTISTVPNGSFAGLRIRRIDLSGSDNRLVVVGQEAFNGLADTLEELLFHLDAATEFPDQALAGLVRLRVLEVNGYRKRTSLPVGALNHLTSLERLVLVDGALQSLTPTDVAGQNSTLTYLDLTGNVLPAVPTSALATLTKLRVLNISSNKISTLDARAFVGPGGGSSSSLADLTLSNNNVNEKGIDPRAFDGLGASLRSLTMKSCNLDDAWTGAFKSLHELRYLCVDYNRVTNVEPLIVGTSSLERLEATSNRIATLKASMFHVVAASLRVLLLSVNPLVDVTPDAFSGLVALEKLYLDGAQRLDFDANSLGAQRRTLQILSLNKANVSRSTWSAIAGLKALVTLQLSGCSLGNVPDFGLAASVGLSSLNLDSNGIDSLTQRSLAGLQDSLELLILKSNRLTTLDRCVFYQFTKLKPLKVNLDNNPLRCDCNIYWLYDLVKDNIEFEFLNWRCANPDRPFSSLTPADFANCTPTSTASPCEDLRPTTAESVTFPSDPNVRINVTDRTPTTVNVSWWVAADVDIVTQAVTYQLSNSHTTRINVAPPSHAGDLQLVGLQPDTSYAFCVEVHTGDGVTRKSCAQASTLWAPPATTTKPSTAGVSLELILGVSIGCAVAAIVVVVVIVVCASRQRQRRASEPVTSTAPKQSIQTKRFRKAGVNGEQRTSGSLANVTDADVDRAIVETVERLNPESKEALVKLLRHASAASLDRLGDTSAYVRSPYYQHQYGAGDVMTPSTDTRNVYEELPDDDTYDQIPTDDTV